MIRKVLVLASIIAMALIPLVIPSVGKTVGDPFTCEGYPEPRQYWESQSWWMQTGDEANNPVGRHIHVGACFPLHQTLDGPLTLDVVIKLHNNPGVVKALRWQVFESITISKGLNFSCATDCTQVVPITADLSKVPNGRWENRLTANIPTNVFGKRQYQTTRWHFFVRSKSGHSVGTTRSPGAAGWYNGIYNNVFCGYNDSGYNLATNPITSPFTLTCKFEGNTSFASIDPSFHALPPDQGTILLNSSTGGTKTIVIDPSTLTPGPHKLFLRTDQQMSDGLNSGVLVLPFIVG